MNTRQRKSFAKRKSVRIHRGRLLIFVAIFVIIIICLISLLTKTFGSDEAMSRQMQNEGKIMLAARAYVYSGLTYDPSYFGGYPPDDRGVCTDVVWKGLMGIDVTLKELVDNDINNNFSAYKKVIEDPDPGIDFRNVPVLEIFFQRHSEELTTNPHNLLAWRPGDIVIFESSHVAVVSVTRNIFGEPYVIQHGKDPAADEDRINAEDGLKISSHFRWEIS